MPYTAEPEVLEARYHDNVSPGVSVLESDWLLAAVAAAVALVTSVPVLIGSAASVQSGSRQRRFLGALVFGSYIYHGAPTPQVLSTNQGDIPRYSIPGRLATLSALE